MFRRPVVPPFCHSANRPNLSGAIRGLRCAACPLCSHSLVLAVTTVALGLLVHRALCRLRALHWYLWIGWFSLSLHQLLAPCFAKVSAGAPWASDVSQHVNSWVGFCRCTLSICALCSAWLDRQHLGVLPHHLFHWLWLGVGFTQFTNSFGFALHPLAVFWTLAVVLIY